jgi:hypothetical protein
LTNGFHPPCFKEAISVVLKKPDGNSALPESYRIIALLNYLAKISEKSLQQDSHKSLKSLTYCIPCKLLGAGKSY